MKKKKLRMILIIFIAIALLSAFFIWQNNDIQVSEYQINTDKLNSGDSGLKIVHISDLHNKMFYNNNKRLIQLIEQAGPDVIVITGDLVDCVHTDVEKAGEFLKSAVKVAPVYYVNGNHELRLEYETRTQLNGILEQYGVININNETKEINVKDGTVFNLLGLSDGDLSNNTLSDLTGRINNENLSILLAHEPQYIDKYSNENVDIVLSGHAHGGQVRLPFIGGLVAPGQGVFPQYTKGTYQVNNTTLVVSRGLGNSLFPFRIFNRPEIVVLTIN